MAVFTESPFFRDARLRSFPFDPACFTEGFASFFRRPFPDGLGFTDFSAFTSVGIRLRVPRAGRPCRLFPAFPRSPASPLHKLGAISPDHYLIPRRVGGKLYDPTKPPSRWGWRTAWRKLTEEAGLGGLRPHDLRHHAITKLAESPEASEQTIMSIAGHVSREMLEHYSHVRQEAKRRAVESLDNVTITSQLAKWEAEAEQRDAKKPNNNGKNWSGRADLNCRPLAPQASALPG